MAPWAGYKLIQIQRNVNYIFAIELIVAGAANYVASKGMKSGKGTSKVLKLLNEVCSFRNGDRSLQIEITNIYKILKLGRLQERISKYLILE